jgi:hypothetical protein
MVEVAAAKVSDLDMVADINKTVIMRMQFHKHEP